jgi:hypothetical protein
MAQTIDTARGRQALLEILLIFAVFCLHGAYPVPDSNEAHYLAKAKHFWNPDWAASDFFLESADAHEIFYWTFGWLTLWLDLPQVAWVGRILTWILLAWSWQRLSWAVIPQRWLSIFTAAVFVGLSENAHMAGEWVVGGIEAKGFAYVLVFFALERLVRWHWRATWLLLGLATAFHVLVGGWAMVATAVAWIAGGAQRPPLRTLAPAILVAVVMALPSVYLGLSLSKEAGSTTIAEANRVYVLERLPHHLSAPHFALGFLTRHVLLQASWLLLITLLPPAQPGERSLRLFVAATIGLAWIGFALGWLVRDNPERLAAVMRYYWFRTSDAFVPLGVSFCLTRFVASLLATRPPVGRAWLAGTLLLLTIDTAMQIDHFPFRIPVVHDEPATPRTDKNVNYLDWIDACEWIVENTEEDDIVLTPRMSATFKWHTGRPEVATWKDVPQDAGAIKEWWDRMNEIYGTGDKPPLPRWRRSLAEHGPAQLHELMAKYDAEYVIVELRDDVEALTIEPLHANASYVIFRREQLVRPDNG